MGVDDATLTLSLLFALSIQYGSELIRILK